MSLRDFALQGLQTALNALIQRNDQAAARFARLHGQVVAIALRGTEWVFYFVPDEQGGVQILGSIEGDPDALIEGSPLDLMRANDPQQGTAQLFAGHVSMQGDTELAQQFSAALGSLQLDWEELLSKVIGDVAAHEVGRNARQAKQEGQRIGALWQENLAEYLTEEARVLPHPLEVEDWLGQVETLRDDLERLSARVELLKNRENS